MKKVALITGVTGQDGSYLSELLLEKNYEVYGFIRRSSTPNTSNLKNVLENPSFHLVYGDLSDSSSINKIVKDTQPDEIYNLAAQSYVGVSFEKPEYTSDVNALGVLRFLEAIRNCGLKDKTKIYQASTSELFGNVQKDSITEETQFHPKSPYGVAKLFGYWIIKSYRESYNIFASNGILFNHESPRRGEAFLTRKITLAVARIKKGLQDCLHLGNLEAKRDWGYAKDYVEIMWKILQQEVPEDYVVGTGEAHSVREFLEEAFRAGGIEIESNGKEGVEEEFVRKDNGKVVVRIDPKFYRPVEIEFLQADFSKGKKILGWDPKTKFKELVKIMVEGDLKKVEEENGKTDFEASIKKALSELQGNENALAIIYKGENSVKKIEENGKYEFLGG